MKYDKSVFQAFVQITQFSINMLVPIFLCSFLGMYIDKKAGTSFWVIILFFAGALAGFRNVFLFAKQIYSKSSDRRHDKKNHHDRKKQLDKKN